MIPSEHLRRQHREMRELVVAIQSHLQPENLAADAATVRKLVATLLGKLRIHLSMEDESLYPRLFAHAEPEIQRVAQQFNREMGGIAEAIDGYRQAWPTATSIRHAPDEFIRQTKALFADLTTRIDRENVELYPLFDRQEK